ncbi:hypothetical protein [Actinoplanes sp. DH11]|uniref:hypothetical protein n=1 Tax=Actinoplanes sp. DH11 TaxID=2857011 RepID=UPI001E432027|nr:hypothetical protein [Actinoplanes sp. DH11]
MNDEEYGALLLRPLDSGTPDGPSAVDVRKAMRDGLRVRRVRTWSAAATVTAGVAAVVTGGVLALAPPRTPDRLPPVLPADPGVPAACTPAALPTGAAGSAGVTGGDPTGVYLVGTTEPVAGGAHGVLVWRDGKLVEEIASTSPKVSMTDINTSGTAVGATVEGTTTPFALHDGAVKRMKGTGSAVAINEAGTIAGETESRSGRLPQRWASWDAEPQMMPMPDGMTGGQAYDITEDGTVLTSVGDGTRNRAYLWHADGSVEPIDPPDLGPDQEFVQPLAFRFGWVYAQVNTPAVSRTGPGGLGQSIYRYEPGSRTWQQLTTESYAVQVSGPHRMANMFMQDEPAVYVGKEVLRLPPLKLHDDDSFSVTVVSDNARVVAGANLSGIAAERPVHPVIWRCR